MYLFEMDKFFIEIGIGIALIFQIILSFLTLGYIIHEDNRDYRINALVFLIILILVAIAPTWTALLLLKRV